ncbi:NAD-dependent epimerase/dehydratase family protein, partial [Paracoccaceae bacterium]|nr:NAD-dependent epimerase/dehydratase family protein [Paracoccaceae bacterium]
EPTNEGYALAKIIIARLCEYINAENPKFKYKTMIPCNIYGKYDSFDSEKSHLLPAIIQKIHFAKENNFSEVEIWGDGKSRREFMYAGDLADAVVFSLTNFENMPFLLNIGVGYDHSINEYYKMVASILGFNGTFRNNYEKPVGMKRKLVSIKRQESWGWKAKTDLQKGIELTYHYYKRELSK